MIGFHGRAALHSALEDAEFVRSVACRGAKMRLGLIPVLAQVLVSESRARVVRLVLVEFQRVTATTRLRQRPSRFVHMLRGVGTRFRHVAARANGGGTSRLVDQTATDIAFETERILLRRFESGLFLRKVLRARCLLKRVHCHLEGVRGGTYSRLSADLWGTNSGSLVVVSLNWVV